MKRQTVDVVVKDAESIVDTLLAQGSSQDNRDAQKGSCVGECINARHPSIVGRIRVRIVDNDKSHELWMPCLHRLAVREGDRVLIEHPANWPEPIVVGVVDGFAARPVAPLLPGPTLSLKTDESVRVEGQNGQELIEVFQGENGPVVRLLNDDINLEVKGKFSINAQRIDLGADEGKVRITARDDVEVEGRLIKLN